MNKTTFLEKKQEFDKKNSNVSKYTCFLPVHLTQNKKVNLKKTNGQKNEEYYKWQFLYAIVHSGLFAKDYIGTEIQLPKGNKSSAPLKIDACIFDNESWFKKYEDYHQNKNNESLEWLREHLLVTIEFKQEDNKNVSDVWNKQLKAYLNESRREFCLGILYDTERLYLFRKHKNKFLRHSEEFNAKGEDSTNGDLSLHLTDPYINIPSFEDLGKWTQTKEVDRSKRNIDNLDIISGIHSTQINDAMSSILRTMDTVGMVNQNGFEVLIQILALKIFDEKENEKNTNNYLNFYITQEEKNYSKLSDNNLQSFIKRIKDLKENAKGSYHKILNDGKIDYKEGNHIKVLIEVVSQFQDYSFVRSHKTNLYQLVFYKFANKFHKTDKAQFPTPLHLIDFLVSIVNPRNGESVIDPTVGIADFLSVAYVNSQSKLDDGNIYGMDVDQQMVMLASLNMLLNGDGNAKIEAKSGHGSLSHKFNHQGDILELDTNTNRKGNWDHRADTKKLKKFDVVLTNPPFGKGRAFIPKNANDEKLIECYELWHLYGGKKQVNKIDFGVIFLENAYRILKENGRLGIVLSNSIASIDSHKIARDWLMEKMRIVAIFDLPANVFAETGVNTTLIIAYKPEENKLKQLQKQNYQVFSRNIKKVGYEVKTSKRVKYFAPIYKINYETFEIETDKNGNSVIDEEFTQTIKEFKGWCLGQEEQLQQLFIEDK